MMHTTTLRLSGFQHSALRAHLFPGDDLEAVALALCGRRDAGNNQILTCRHIEAIPYAECRFRSRDRITWSTDRLEGLLAQAVRRNLAVVKLHSHPQGYPRFSEFDDRADRDLFRSVFGWVDGDLPHASTVMLPGGRMFGRAAFPGAVFGPLRITVAGDDLHVWGPGAFGATGEFALRHEQLFGRETVSRLRGLTVGVVGCSGTGSPTIEQLARLGVGRLVLVDPDRLEMKNLNRILNATVEQIGRMKVDVAADAVIRMGLGTSVIRVPFHLSTPQAVRAVAECDVVFGCMDSAEGRHMLSRIAAFYLIPYFDIGVKLTADGAGSVSEVCGAVHYLQPGGSSLLSRGVYTMERVRAEGLRRSDPVAYADQWKAGYIDGVQEESPAVISVNMQLAATAVNEFLARLHPYRHGDNADSAIVRVSLIGSFTDLDEEGEPCGVIAPHVGRGDVRPLLEMSELSDGDVR